jgi:hypothetical protein
MASSANLNRKLSQSVDSGLCHTSALIMNNHNSDHSVSPIHHHSRHHNSSSNGNHSRHHHHHHHHHHHGSKQGLASGHVKRRICDKVDEECVHVESSGGVSGSSGLNQHVNQNHRHREHVSLVPTVLNLVSVF